MKRFREKYDLLTAIVLCFLVFVILSWIVPTATFSDSSVAEGAAVPVGLFSLFYYPGITLGTFVQFGLVILALGAFYGVVAKTGVYGSLVDKTAQKYKGKEKIFLIVVSSLLILINAIFGTPYALLIVVPFLIAVFSKLGFNKITCFAGTFGSILLGNLGSVCGYSIAGTSSILLGLKVTEGIIPRIIYLALLLVLYILFISSNVQTEVKTKVVDKKDKKDSKNVKEESSNEKILFLENEEVKNKKVSTLAVLVGLTLLIAIVSMFNWNSLFNISFFEDIYEKIIAIKIGDYAIFSNLLGLDTPFGYWDTYELVALLLIASIVIGWVYNLSLVDLVDGIKEGAKRLLKPAFYVTIANIIFVFMVALAEDGLGNIPVYITAKLAGMSESFNFITTTTSGFLGSFFYNNYTQFFNYIGEVLVINMETDYYALLGFILQGTHSIMMLLLPTSLVLVAGLSMLDVKISDWLKYIGWLILQLLVIFLIIILFWLLLL